MVEYLQKNKPLGFLKFLNNLSKRFMYVYLNMVEENISQESTFKINR